MTAIPITPPVAITRIVPRQEADLARWDQYWDNSKLAKSRRSVNAAVNQPLPQLWWIFSLLGLKPPESLLSAALDDVWRWAFDQWDVNKIPKRLNLRVRDP